MHVPDAVHLLERDLRTIFGAGLQSLVMFSPIDRKADAPAPTLALVTELTVDDLGKCAARVDEWHDSGLATPLLLPAREFVRALDAFPLEFGAILAEHVVVAGENPFQGLSIDRSDLRRACERQARSHLLHLREGFLETRGRGDRIAELIVRSAPPLAALVRTVARLQGVAADDVQSAATQVESMAGLTSGVIADVARLASAASITPDVARETFPRYLDAMDTLTSVIDRWSAS